MVSVMDGKSNNIDRLLFGLSSYEVPLVNNTTYLLKPATPSAWSDSEIINDSSTVLLFYVASAISSTTCL